MDYNAQVKELLSQLLTEKSPEPGARLKHRLNLAFINRGLGSFDEKAYGYQKFKDYLLREHGDILSIAPQEMSDVLVSLRHVPTGLASPGANTINKDQPSVVRSEVWQAFSNPDVKRKRYLHKSTGALRHFIEGEACDAKHEVEASQGQYLEIQPITGVQQIEWMKEYLNSLRLPPDEKSAIDALANEPYSSGSNATFSRALGVHGTGWRNFRTNRMVACIKEWAKNNSVPFQSLCLQHRQEKHEEPVKQSAAAILTPRQQAIKLLELLSDEDIARLVIPTLLSSILIKSRL